VRTTVLRRVAVHDRYQLELKLGYPLIRGEKTRYRIDTYLFAPHSLGINPTIYDRTEFFRDIQHYVRMKTPRFRLNQVLSDPTSPLLHSEEILNENIGGLTAAIEDKLRNRLRILRAILKSATQIHVAPLMQAGGEPSPERAANYAALIESLLAQITAIEERYRALEQPLVAASASAELLRTYRLTDESISILVEEVLLHVHQVTAQWVDAAQCALWRTRLATQIRGETEHRQAQGYPSVLRKRTNEEYMRRVSALKKFTSSVLWLSITTRREGTTLEQVLFATAAGISMTFATLVAFYAQAVYGQFTAPVFLALVIAYMFKDRIKELGRAFSAQLLSQRLFDYRTTIQTQDGRRQLGQVREKMTHIEPHAVPAQVQAARATGLVNELEFAGSPESAILYAKLVELRADAFQYLTEDGLEITALNDIMRYDVRPFLRKMDDPYEERLMLRGDEVVPVRCHRTYHLNLVSVFAAEDGTTTCERTLLVLDRKGILRIEQYDALGATAHEAEQATRVEDLSEIDYPV